MTALPLPNHRHQHVADILMDWAWDKKFLPLLWWAPAARCGQVWGWGQCQCQYTHRVNKNFPVCCGPKKKPLAPLRPNSQGHEQQRCPQSPKEGSHVPGPRRSHHPSPVAINVTALWGGETHSAPTLEPQGSALVIDVWRGRKAWGRRYAGGDRGRRCMLSHQRGSPWLVALRAQGDCSWMPKQLGHPEQCFHLGRTRQGQAPKQYGRIPGAANGKTRPQG